MPHHPTTSQSFCPCCKLPYSSEVPRSRDHIVPRYCGGSFSDEDNNIRFICADCNGLLGNLGNCIGALACILDLQSVTGIKAQKIATTLSPRGTKYMRRAWAKARKIEMIPGVWVNQLRTKK